MSRTSAALASSVLLVLTGCGVGSGSDPAEQADLSPMGITDVVADHVDRAAAEVEAWDVMTDETGEESPGAAMRFDDEDFLAVAVSPTSDSPLVCADDTFFDECVGFRHDGTDLVLAWQDEEPEEDPGVVYVIDRREDEDVVAHYSGVTIDGDPRELDLGVTVDEMAAVVTDDRLTLG